LSDIVFSTSRLLIRKWRNTDVAALLAVYGDIGAMRWVSDGQAITMEACLKWLEVTQQNYVRRGYGMFAVEQQLSPGIVGFCGIVHPDGQKDAEIKYAYRREFWGQGFATEAAIGLIEYGTAAHGINHFIATTAPENTASHHVLLKAGMKRGALGEDSDGFATQLFYLTK
jgi:RimJ/RimL family protein N-acetyltransferase